MTLNYLLSPMWHIAEDKICCLVSEKNFAHNKHFLHFLWQIELMYQYMPCKYTFISHTLLWPDNLSSSVPLIRLLIATVAVSMTTSVILCHPMETKEVHSGSQGCVSISMRLVQERRNSSALAMELCLPCTNLWIWARNTESKLQWLHL